MRIQINLCIYQGDGQLFNTIGRTAPGKLVGNIFALVIGDYHTLTTVIYRKNKDFSKVYVTKQKNKQSTKGNY
jgi:hypothetical protein